MLPGIDVLEIYTPFRLQSKTIFVYGKCGPVQRLLKSESQCDYEYALDDCCYPRMEPLRRCDSRREDDCAASKRLRELSKRRALHSWKSVRCELQGIFR